MPVRSTILFRVAAMAVALVFGLSAAGQTFAQGSIPGAPAGLQDGAQATYTNQSDGSILVLTDFRFQDEQSATDGVDAITTLFEQQLSSSLSGSGMSPSATTSEATAEASDIPSDSGAGAEATAAATPVEIENAKGLDNVGDEAHAYQLDVAKGIEIYYLVIRDSTDVHLWAYVSADLGSLGGGEATAAATAGPNGSALDVLTGIASDWFSDGSHASDSPADALPSQDALPQGFSLTDQTDSLNPSATPGAMLSGR